MSPGVPSAPQPRALIAVDLGAESCRVSLLRWRSGEPRIEVVHRFANGAENRDGALCWDLERILADVDEGLRAAAERAPEGVQSIGVDGWAVDYVRLDANGAAVAPPFCYRDPRARRAELSLHKKIAPDRLRALSAIQLQSINTVYQQHADSLAGATARWLNLPEFLLFRWGGAPVAERTNATHTGMLGRDGAWSEEIFNAAGLLLEHAPRIVEAGTEVGCYAGPVATLRGARLIAPCCHDTASAVAGIPDARDDWAYISSGTWSLVGTVLPHICNTAEAASANFTNLGAAGGRVLFHKGMPGMWLLRQCMLQWNLTDLPALIELARGAPPVPSGACLDVNDPVLGEPGDMLGRLHAQRAARGLAPLHEPAAVARLLFESLAREYTAVLRSIQQITGKRLVRVYVVGGGSQNELLNALLARYSGLEVRRGAVESSTIGNFAVQLAAAAGERSAESVARIAASLAHA